MVCQSVCAYEELAFAGILLTLTGEFGEVYKAQLTPWNKPKELRVVAVKTLRGKLIISIFRRWSE